MYVQSQTYGVFEGKVLIITLSAIPLVAVIEKKG